jgi:hypothetical protein
VSGLSKKEIHMTATIQKEDRRLAIRKARNQTKGKGGKIK